MIKIRNYLICSLSILLLSGCVQKPVYVQSYKAPTVKKLVIAKTVGVTGAAGELKRLTFGGYEELVSKLSNDKNWLLIDTYSIENGVRSNTIIQKLNVHSGAKMILTPANSDNKRAIWSSYDESIIFTTKRSGSAIVESMGVNGENGVKFITNSSLGTSSDANMNKEGTDIVFVLNDSISMINPNGTQIRMFGNGFGPKFSPNGEKVLFAKKAGDYIHLFTMRNNGTELMEITSEAANDYEGSWSPDGNKIAFISNRANNHNHLYVMDAAGDNIIQLTDGEFDVSSLDWGDDGFIYFSANAGGNRDIWKLKPIK
uniref:TolB family protein n=1 Tax=Aliarcobacter sp. TaxID=2321116 RepID=UPI004047811A